MTTLRWMISGASVCLALGMGLPARAVASGELEERYERTSTPRIAAGNSCLPFWLPTFGGEPGLSSTVHAFAVYDDGWGPALYAGGLFSTAGGVMAPYLAKWDGARWSDVGLGLNGAVNALTVHDDGSGPALYVAGEFTNAGGVPANRIARWNGTSWSALGSGVNGVVNALSVYDGGDGPALHAAGLFTMAGGSSASRIAKWNGTSWSALGLGVGGSVNALAVYESGGESALVAGGGFSSAGGVAAIRIAKWNGATWSALGNGVNSTVHALAVHEHNGVPSLFAGGDFTIAGAVSTEHIARWNGTNWFPLGASGGTDILVRALASYDDGSGPALYVGGSGDPTNGQIARWNGTSWSALDGGVKNASSAARVLALAVHDDGSGPTLFVGGSFDSAGSGDGEVTSHRIAKWDGASWSAPAGGMSNSVFALAVYDDGGGPSLYAGGNFKTASGATVNNLARWSGTSWVSVGGGVDGEVLALTVYDDGSGPALFAGGRFLNAGGAPASRIAKWDGTSWSSLASGTNGTVKALVVHEDGTSDGPLLYAGGSFTSAGGAAASKVAIWSGSFWSPCGSGSTNGDVLALASYDDGSGRSLYAGGQFTTAGGVAASSIARWNGALWSPLGSGMFGAAFSPYVAALTVYDDGAGAELYAGGYLTSAGGVPANMIARWNGSAWSALGSGMAGGGGFPRGDVFSLTVHDAGEGPALYAGGYFTSAGGVAANHIAKWDGASWSPLGGGMIGSSVLSVAALTTYDVGGRPALCAAGDFPSAVDSGDSYVARWGLPPDTIAPTISCPEQILVTDLPGSPPGEVVTFSISASDECSASLDVVCTPPSGSVFPVGSTTVFCSATDAAGNHSLCQFPVVVGRGIRKP